MVLKAGATAGFKEVLFRLVVGSTLGIVKTAGALESPIYTKHQHDHA
jgi:uncharacterized ion transporter superfamily protein YfcC